ncbi:ABC transporter substrate-binding protein [Chachezhania sediminis]|uniref:ABC transporter substrate-binding protein n=1 Tax=Chachezhania sediminis TaxID=2599291 RepID=UPI00131D9721|nr:ABC transporter substrate-binding protein [Chachezhania sediminis]
MKRRQLLTGLGAGGLGAAALSALNAGAAHAQTGDPIPIGAALPMSGPSAGDGIEFKNGLDLAAAEINAAGGILGRPVEIHIEDTREMGADLVGQAMQRLIDRYNTPAIVNGYNLGANMVELDVAADNDVIVLHNNTQIAHQERVKSDPERYYGGFQTDPAEYWYGPGCLNFLNELVDAGQWKPANRKIAIVASAVEYSIVIGNAIRDKAAEFGWEVSVYETVPFPTNQWGPVLAKLREDPPAAILVTHFLAQDLAQFMTQFLTQPTPSLIYMQYGPSLPVFREIGGEAINGVIYSTVIGGLPDAFAAKYREDYRANFGDTASWLTGSQTYDALWMYATAAAVAGGPGEPFNGEQARKVAGVLKGMVHRGMSGSFRFDPEGLVAYSYPTETKDPSLGLPHQFLQHQDYRTDPKLIGPQLYADSQFMLPPWLS